MRKVTRLATVDEEKCSGCGTCRDICPVVAVEIVNRLAQVDDGRCVGCANCEQRCPEYAIKMVDREEPFTVSVDVDAYDEDAIFDLCVKAKFHPEQVVCFCTGTRAGEIAAAILGGARSPEEVSARTGARTGCKVLCIEPVLRLLSAAGLELGRAPGYQWYGLTATLWDLDEKVKEKYSGRGFYFDADREFLEENLRYELGRREKGE